MIVDHLDYGYVLIDNFLRPHLHRRELSDDISLRTKRPYSELFWSVISRIRTEYGEIRSISPY